MILQIAIGIAETLGIVLGVVLFWVIAIGVQVWWERIHSPESDWMLLPWECGHGPRRSRDCPQCEEIRQRARPIGHDEGGFTIFSVTRDPQPAKEDPRP